jgi:hypothetical protein
MNGTDGRFGEGFEEFWDPEDLARAEEQRQQEQSSKPNGADGDWPDPDLGVLTLRRREPPELPLDTFGREWGSWIEAAAKTAACPPDYVAMPLLASASVLIGNARWAQATPGWEEPPHLWTIVVGESGEGKSPGADCLQRDVLPELARRMIGDYPERHREWQAAVAFDKAARRRYEEALRAAQKADGPSELPRMPQPTASDIEPEEPRLRQHDVTIEQVAAILATAAPKGVVIVRDEIAGWFLGLTAYNPAGRQFWIEAYGGRQYTVERRKHSTRPIKIPYHAVALSGGTQPAKLAELLTGADDGLFSRILWAWPNPIPFRLGRETPRIAWAIEALDKLRSLDLQPGDPPRLIYTALTSEGQRLLEEFGCEMQDRSKDTGGLLRSAFGKARGAALRLSLVLEWLWWCAKVDFADPPDRISPAAFTAAATLVADYFMPMAARVYGDAAATEAERSTATLARWIIKERPDEVHVRHLQRVVRLPGLRSAEQIRKAADALVDADWLQAPPKTVVGQVRNRISYPVNPKLKGIVL